MPRIARLVVPGLPHHVVQRGNRRQQTFFSASDCRAYLTILAEWTRASGVEVWAYCLMPNHVHIIATPSHGAALATALGETHRRYSQMVNQREGWRGYLWQGRFLSCPMDEAHLFAAAEYVLLNPVRARLVHSPERWRYSALQGLLGRRNDPLVAGSPLRAFARDWFDRWSAGERATQHFDAEQLRLATRTGRPWGSATFVRSLELQFGMRLVPGKAGRPRSRKSG